MNRKLIFFIALLACLALPLGHLAAQGNAPAAAEIEPNDTPAQATPIALGLTTANNDSAADVDWFKLNLTAGQSLHIEMAEGCNVDLENELGIYKPDGTPLATGAWLLSEVIIPTTGLYTIRVTNPDDYQEQLGGYQLAVFQNSAGEPNDSYADATPLVFGGTVNGVADWPGDYDYYTFQGLAGEMVHITLTNPTTYPYPNMRLARDDGSYWSLLPSTEDSGVSTFTVLLPVTGRYELYTFVDGLGCYNHLTSPQPYQITLERLGLYVAGNGTGKAGGANGVPFGPNDILVRNTAGQWRKAFDGEDVGLTKPISGFEFMDDGSLLMAVQAPQLPGVGAVRPQDIVRFTPTHLGDNTQGAFSMYLRGADVGLTTNAERIDAIGLTLDGALLVSTMGKATVPAAAGGTLTAADEGILQYAPPGKWVSYFSMADWWFSDYATFAAENITAMTRATPEHRINGYTIDLFITLTSDYRFYTNGDRFLARKGDVIGLHWQHGLVEDVKWGIARGVLGFPKPINSLSIGPEWGNN